MLNEDVDLGVIKVTKDKDVSKVILGWVEGLVLVTVMMIVIVEVVGEVMTKNRLMVTIHSKDVTEILALYRRSEIDFPPHFLVRLMHSFPMMYNTI